MPVADPPRRRLHRTLAHLGARPPRAAAPGAGAAAGAPAAAQFHGGAREGPLAGVRVIDLGNIYHGPYCGFLFAQAGADVVKVEAPSGDGARGLSKPGGVRHVAAPHPRPVPVLLPEA